MRVHQEAYQGRWVLGVNQKNKRNENLKMLYLKKLELNFFL
jgi:hypothetical protein